MKSFVCAIFVAQAIIQLTNAQAIRAVNVAAPLVSSCGNQIISPCGNQIISPCGNQVVSPYGNQIISPYGNQIISPYGNQIISSCGNPIAGSCGCGGQIISPVAPVIASQAIIQPSVANSLADTLSLLTVSSLLADALPLGSNVLVPGCGCGYGGYGYGGLYY